MPSNLQPILFLVLIAAVFYLLMIRPQQKKRKEMQSMLQALKPGSEIVTTAGLYGKVVSLEGDDSLLIEVAPGVTCKYLRQAVMRVVPDQTAAPAQPESLPESSNGTVSDKSDKSDSDAAKDEPQDEPTSTVTKDDTAESTEASDADAASDDAAKSEDAGEKETDGSDTAGDRRASS